MRDRDTLKLSSAIALAYAACGIVALQFAIPPGNISLLYPPAGIALAALLLFGNRVWPAITIGALAVSLLATHRAGLGGAAFLGALIVPLGATVQALAGAWMVRRWVGFPGQPDHPRAILLFLFVCAPLSCVINASFAVPALVAAGTIPADDALVSLSSWWIGDTLGVLIACPLMIAVLGRHTLSDWQSRRRTFVVPMAAALLLIGALILQVNQWERQRVRLLFEGNASHLSGQIQTRLAGYLYALQSTRELMAIYPETRRSAFSAFASPWLTRLPGIFALGWAPRVTDAGRSRLEEAMRHEGLADFRISERNEEGRLYRAPRADIYFPVIYNEPADRNRHSFGLNPLNFPPAAAAIRNTLAHSGPAASKVLRLVQDPDRQTGIVVYQSVYAREHADAPLGLVVLGLRMGDVLQAALDTRQLDGIGYCLADITGNETSLLGGSPDCLSANGKAALNWSEDFEFAGRTWRLSFHAGEQYFATHRSWAAWTLLALGLASIALLSAFLLLNSGRARKVAELVAERTSQLEAATIRLRAQQAMLAHAQSIARLGSWEADPVTGGGAWSDELFHILGLAPKPVGQLADLAEALHPQDRPQFQRLLSELADSMPAATLDARLVHADGEERAV
ncbi:MAG: diguanylate cyclase, partial [Zoogloea sp.]|nr:diguanylate cyclase [Zoogloea sp.]